MTVKTPKDLGLIVKNRRREKRLSQEELAKAVGATRQWVIGLERGKGSAGLGLVLKTVRVLGLTMDLRTNIHARSTARPMAVDIDRIIERARGIRL